MARKPTRRKPSGDLPPLKIVPLGFSRTFYGGSFMSKPDPLAETWETIRKKRQQAAAARNGADQDSA